MVCQNINTSEGVFLMVHIVATPHSEVEEVIMARIDSNIKKQTIYTF